VKSRSTTPTSDDARCADLRAAIARDGRKLYLIAAAAGIHPTALGSMLRGRVTLSEAVAARVRRVLR
jgi:hypothetical protein